MPIVILTVTIFLVLSFNHFKVILNLGLHSGSGFLTFFGKYQFKAALEAHAKTGKFRFSTFNNIVNRIGKELTK